MPSLAFLKPHVIGVQLILFTTSYYNARYLQWWPANQKSVLNNVFFEIQWTFLVLISIGIVTNSVILFIHVPIHLEKWLFAEDDF